MVFKVDHFREPVDHGHDGSVAFGGREASDKVQGYV